MGLGLSRIQTAKSIGTENVPIHWHSAGSLGGPFTMLKYNNIFQIKYTGAILSNSTRKLLRFEITKMLIAVLKNLVLRLYTFTWQFEV